MDVIEIDAASNNGVENIRELRESVKYPPAVGRKKVYIIDEVHMLSTGAFNALLKTLEEPPENVIFILATTEPQKLPATILSRCLRLDFKRVPQALLMEGMCRICAEKGVSLTDSALKLLDEAGLPGELRLRQKLALVAMVGAGVTRNPLHCHRFWQQLKGQPVEFTWQSEEGISLVAVLRAGPTESLIQGLHQSLFRAEKRIGLVLFGKGNIGSRWLELFAREQTTLSARTGFEFILAGVVDSRRSLLNYEGLDASRALAFFNDEAVEQDEESLFLWMRAHPYDDLVVLDVTASAQLADQYLDFASHGFHVISANKLAGASSSSKYRQIHDAFEKTGRHWLYNATVGAGLPVNHTVRDLIDSGDTILALSGIFSGTLSWLFLQFDGTVPFTDLVDQAWQQGLTEPDPRVDLSGKDVMRKLVILAREAGYNIEPDQVRVESLVPAHCEEGSVDHFFENGEALNEQMLQRLEAAREMGLVLRYVARFDANGKARVGVEAVREEHPLAALLPCDNVFAIESRFPSGEKVSAASGYPLR